MCLNNFSSLWYLKYLTQASLCRSTITYLSLVVPGFQSPCPSTASKTLFFCHNLGPYILQSVILITFLTDGVESGLCQTIYSVANSWVRSSKTCQETLGSSPALLQHVASVYFFFFVIERMYIELWSCLSHCFSITNVYMDTIKTDWRVHSSRWEWHKMNGDKIHCLIDYNYEKREVLIQMLWADYQVILL